MLLTYLILLLNTFQIGTLSVKVENVRSSDGYIYVALYSKDNEFPVTMEKADKIKKIKAVKGTVIISFQNLEKGFYAVSVYQDVNSNKKMDTTILGIPKEPIGVSNNVKGFMGPPSYDDCKFYFLKSTIISVRLSH